MKTKNLILHAAACLMIATAGSSHAANGTWTNAGTTDFNLSSNWTPGLPGAADRGIFDGAAAIQPDLSASITLSGITFNTAATSGYTLSSTSGSLTLTSTAIGNTLAAIRANNTSGTNTISAPIILGQAAASGAGFYQATNGTLAITGNISSTNAISGLTLTGQASGSKFTLSGNNTYSGNTTMIGASNLLNINSATAISSGTLITGTTSTQTAQIDNTSGVAVVLANNNNVNSSGNLIYAGTGDLSFGSGSFTSTGATRTVTTNGSATLTFGSLDASASGIGFTKAGGGTLRVAGAAGANLTGDVTLSAGTTIVGNKSSLGSGLLLLSGGNLSASTALTGANAIANNWTLAGLSGFSGTNSIELSGIGAGQLVTANRVLTNNISGGSLILSGATLGLSSTAATNTITFAGSGNSVVSSVIQNNAAGGTATSGNVTINAPGGTVTLEGANTYTGTTTVTAGTLLINGAQTLATGNVTVAASAVLGGNGTIGGATSIATNGILAPGTTLDSTSTLTFNNTDLTLSGTDSKVNMDITGTADGAFDKLAGIATFAMNGDITFTLSGTYGSASWDVMDFTSKSGNFDSITLAGSYTGTFTRIGDTWTGVAGLSDWTFEQSTGVLSVVPEPSTWVLLAFSLTTMMAFRRRCRS
jgi:autotransporter-associated beta strand protein